MKSQEDLVTFVLNSIQGDKVISVILANLSHQGGWPGSNGQMSLSWPNTSANMLTWIQPWNQVHQPWKNGSQRVHSATKGPETLMPVLDCWEVISWVNQVSRAKTDVCPEKSQKWRKFLANCSLLVCPDLFIKKHQVRSYYTLSIIYNVYILQ